MSEIEPPMHDLKVGDRVRVSAEGVVTLLYSGGRQIQVTTDDGRSLFVGAKAGEQASVSPPGRARSPRIRRPGGVQVGEPIVIRLPRPVLF